MALTDHDGVWGSMEFAHACKGHGMRALTGAELTVALPGDAGLTHLTLLVETQAGYSNLCRLITTPHHSGERRCRGVRRCAGAAHSRSRRLTGCKLGECLPWTQRAMAMLRKSS